MIDAAHVVLPVAAFITSALTGVVGMGGGLMLLLVMAEFLSFTALIPVHGVNQFITHFSRAAVSFRDINYRIRRFKSDCFFLSRLCTWPLSGINYYDGDHVFPRLTDSQASAKQNS
ncbi:MAG: hypothetical protein KZQ99_12920 [Candidatus Thiodiazotropha sp. (ex Dulcina madagascariensis)]|nr:hypothetical protein [Candidatus Thiodiazotropha sp. (ex Dulcina madagascariensis)]